MVRQWCSRKRVREKLTNSNPWQMATSTNVHFFGYHLMNDRKDWYMYLRRLESARSLSRAIRFPWSHKGTFQDTP